MLLERRVDDGATELAKPLKGVQIIQTDEPTVASRVAVNHRDQPPRIRRYAGRNRSLCGWQFGHPAPPGGDNITGLRHDRNALTLVGATGTGNIDLRGRRSPDREAIMYLS